MTDTDKKWVLDLEKRTQRARLLSASPEYVYEKLRAYALEQAGWRFSAPDELLEAGLLARAEPLVDLALACFAATPAVVAELWQRTRGAHYRDAQIRKGIRLGCLSNHSVKAERFPAAVIGADDLRAVVAAEDRDEAHALIRNDNIDEDILVALYRHEGPFAGLDDETWRGLVMQSSHNDQINGNQEDEFGDELSQSSTHEAIFHLLETAPPTGPWVVALHFFLESLDPVQVPRPPAGRIGGVLERWRAVEVRDIDGAVQSGVYPGLTYGDEFRCLVGALYGGGRNPDQRAMVFGSASAANVDERCAFYGNTTMTAEAIDQYIVREPMAFAYAASCNPAVMSTPELRRKLEDGASGRDFKDRYLKVLKFYQKRWPQAEYLPLAAWLKSDDRPAATEKGAPESGAGLAELEPKLTRIGTRLQGVERAVQRMLLGMVALAFLILLLLRR